MLGCFLEGILEGNLVRRGMGVFRGPLWIMMVPIVDLLLIESFKRDDIICFAFEDIKTFSWKPNEHFLILSYVLCTLEVSKGGIPYHYILPYNNVYKITPTDQRSAGRECPSL